MSTLRNNQTTKNEQILAKQTRAPITNFFEGLEDELDNMSNNVMLEKIVTFLLPESIIFRSHNY